MSNDPNVLEINVSEEIKIKDVPPGGSSPESGKEKRDQVAAELARLNGLYVEPHKVKSRWVTSSDIPRIISDGRDMATLCNLPRGMHQSALAIAHPQITKNDPLRFFVLPDGKVVINPVIFNHTKFHNLKDTEGCMSFPNTKSRTLVPRFSKIEVAYQTLIVKKGDTEPSIGAPIIEELRGEQAHVMQHEICHFHGSYVFDEDYAPEKALGVGDGKVVDITTLQWEPKIKDINI